MNSLAAIPRSLLGRGLVRWCVLLAVSLASATIWWTGFTRVMWLPALYAIPHLDTPKLLGVTEEAMRTFAAAAGLQTALYLLAFAAARSLRSPRSVALLLLLAVPPAIPLILAYPGGAGDVYAYVAEADSVLQYQVNPFRQPVSAIPAHPLLPFLDYPNETTHYGPLWILAALVMRLLSGPELLSALIAFKLAAVAALLASAWLVFLTLRHRRPDVAAPAALLVAWNPLLIEEFAQNAHNDAAMALLIVLAFYLQARGRLRAAVGVLIAAALVKYVAAVLIPLFLVADLREAGPWRRWFPSAATDAARAALLAAAIVFVAGMEGTVGILQTLSRWFTTSPGAVAYYYLTPALSQEGAATAANNLAKLLFAAAYLVILAWLWHRPRSLAASSLWTLTAFLAIATTWFQPWYAGWAIPVAALLSSATALAVLGGMTVGGFMVHLMMGFAWRLDWHGGNPVTLHALGALAMWIPVAAALLVAAAAAGSRRRWPGSSSQPAVGGEPTPHRQAPR